MQKHVTKDGSPISFTRRYDIEGDENRGWIVHALVATVEGKEAGYMKIAYIPRERFSYHYPSLLHYMIRIRGWCFPELDLLSFEELVANMGRYLNDADLLGYGSKPKKPSRAWFEDKHQALSQRLERLHRSEFKEFEQYHVDKPVVDYSRVYGELDLNNSTKFSDTVVDKSYQRRGIATALYIEATRWMNELGMPLYASGTQSDEAKGLWHWLEQNYAVGKEEHTYFSKTFDRRFLILPDSDRVSNAA